MLLLALVVGALPIAHAQDAGEEAPSIAEILEHAAEDEENPQFTLLLAALEEAGLVPVFAENGPFTVFAPTDAAFQSLLEDLDIEFEALAEDYELLLSVLLNHVLPGHFDAEALSAQAGIPLASGFAGNTLSIEREEGLSVNGAAIIEADIEASNGIVHVIDHVLVPDPEAGSLETLLLIVPEESIAEAVETIAATGNDPLEREFEVFLMVLEETDLLATFENEAAFTIFAPTDAAFEAYADAAGVPLTELLEDTAALTEILLYHVVPFPYLVEDLGHIEDAYLGTMLAGQVLHVAVEGAERQGETEEGRSEGASEAEAATTITVNGATLQGDLADIIGRNGVIHAIDSVLLPGEMAGEMSAE